MPGAARISTFLLLNLSGLLSSSVHPAFAKDPCEILVAAAADLARTQIELSDSFAKTGGCRVRFALGASGMLARQIENGAPYDVYLSANEAFVRQLQERGRLLPESIREYARGRLGLWSSGGRYGTLPELLAPAVRHLSLANPSHAPYGMAARECLQKQGLWDKLASKVVYGENVQQALQYAETGNAEATVTAWPLVHDRSGVLLPSACHTPIRQVGGVVSGTRQATAAHRFLAFLAGEKGRAILRRHGFETDKIAP